MKHFHAIFFALAIPLLMLQAACGDDKKVSTNKVYDLDSLVKLYPDSVPLLVKLGNKYMDAYRADEALKIGAKAFRLDSNNIDARFLYANALVNFAQRSTVDVANAQRHFKKILKSQPKNKKAYILLASTYTQQGDFEKSFQYINEVLKMDPRYRDAYIMKGTNYLALGNRKLAISSYETAIQQDPKFFEAYLRLAQMYTEDENYKLAYEYFRNAAEIEPKSTDALYGIAYTKQMLGEFDVAIKEYKHLIQTDTTYYLALFNIAYIKQFDQNQPDSAIYFYQSALEREPECVKCWHNLGLVYKDKNDVTNALKSFAKALKYNPDFKMSREEADKLR